MTPTQLAPWTSGARWARSAGSHLRWVLRQSRADAADRAGRRFRYVHPIVGRFVYHPSDYLSRRLLLYSDFERDELKFAMDRARAGGTILDVGANIGLYTVACARAAGDHGRIIALEPGPSTYEKLEQTCAALHLSNVTLLRVAAGRINGRADFITRRSGRDVHQHVADQRAHDPKDRTEVDVRRLDDLCGPAVDDVTLVKLDIEGHEVAALAGAPRILQRRRASLIVEFYPSGLAAAGTSPTDLWGLLQRTHECVAVVCQDGSPRPPVESSVSGDDTFNTLWVPRVSSSGPDRG